MLTMVIIIDYVFSGLDMVFSRAKSIQESHSKLRDKAMLKMRIVVLQVILLSILASTGVESAERTAAVTCNNCSYQGYINEARRAAYSYDLRPSMDEYVLGERYRRHVVVVDLKKKNIRKFELLYLASEFDVPPPQYHPEPYYDLERMSEIQIEKDLEHTFVQLAEKIEQLETPRKVPESIARSAWDLVGASYRQTQAAQYFVENASIWDDISVRLGALMKSIKLSPVEVKDIELILEFEDGSKAIFTLERFDNELSPVFSFSSGIDKDGNIIEDKGALFKRGAYSFSQGGRDTAQAFYDAAYRMGYRLPGVPIGTVTLGPISEACWQDHNKDDGNCNH